MTAPIIGYVSLYHLMCYFFIYAFFGWVSEVAFATLKTGKFVNRGFLNGPLCPIYGVGMALCVLLLNPLEEHWWLLMIAGGSLATALEFITGYVLDKIFKTKWWDYSNEPFNIKGYVCLRFSVLWGLAVLLVFKTVVPLVNSLIALVPFRWWGLIILNVCWLIFISDTVTVVIQLKRLKANLKEVAKIAEIIRKSSDRLGEKVSGGTLAVETRLKTVSGKIKNSRLAKAFPRLNFKHEQTGKEYEDLKEKINESSVSENDEK